MIDLEDCTSGRNIFDCVCRSFLPLCFPALASLSDCANRSQYGNCLVWAALERVSQEKQQFPDDTCRDFRCNPHTLAHTHVLNISYLPRKAHGSAASVQTGCVATWCSSSTSGWPNSPAPDDV